MAITSFTFGIQDHFIRSLKERGFGDFSMARVIQVHKERYILRNSDGEWEAEVTGNFRFAVTSPDRFPVVGDWVAMKEMDENQAIIYEVAERKTELVRKSVEVNGQKQILAANIDHAFIVTGLDRDFNMNRIERYIVATNAGNINPVILLSKCDLVTRDHIENTINILIDRFGAFRVISFSNISGAGLAEIKSLVEEGQTYIVIGSSGVGKSSLINTLKQSGIAQTRELSKSTNKGKHTTTSRSLLQLDNGGMIIDTPGMREFGIAGSEADVENTFDDIKKLASDCRFSDCTHTTEPGCAVVHSVENGDLNGGRYANYMKLKRETRHFSETEAEKRVKSKQFGKIQKDAVRFRKKYKY